MEWTYPKKKSEILQGLLNVILSQHTMDHTAMLAGTETWNMDWLTQVLGYSKHTQMWMFIKRF